MFDVCEYFTSRIRTRKFSGYGPVAQVEFAAMLEQDGFFVAVEVAVPYHAREDWPRCGRVDIVAIRDNVVLGIEIDSWRTPKSKSVQKLVAFEALTQRAIFLNHDRHMFGNRVFFPSAVKHMANKIDFAAHLDVSFCSDGDKNEAMARAYSALRGYPRTCDCLPL